MLCVGGLGLVIGVPAGWLVRLLLHLFFADVLLRAPLFGDQGGLFSLRVLVYHPLACALFGRSLRVFFCRFDAIFQGKEQSLMVEPGTEADHEIIELLIFGISVKYECVDDIGLRFLKVLSLLGFRVVVRVLAELGLPGEHLREYFMVVLIDFSI